MRRSGDQELFVLEKNLPPDLLTSCSKTAAKTNMIGSDFKEPS
jgi:hypothetical protein